MPPNSAIQTVTPEPGVAQMLEQLVLRGQIMASGADLRSGLVKMWIGQIRMQIRKGFGPDSKAVDFWPATPETLSPIQARDLLNNCLLKAQSLLAYLNDAPTKCLASAHAPNVFIGHGRSLVWMELKDFLEGRLQLHWNEFNRESAAGIATTERLEQLLASATFAFLIMTAEDEHADKTRHARLNVIHEVGLFQGKLGTRKAIVLLEDGCQQFSNIHGLTHIPFSQGRIGTAFEDVRKVLEREGVTQA